jgi:hypothetical protein
VEGGEISQVDPKNKKRTGKYDNLDNKDKEKKSSKTSMNSLQSFLLGSSKLDWTRLLLHNLHLQLAISEIT